MFRPGLVLATLCLSAQLVAGAPRHTSMLYTGGDSVVIQSPTATTLNSFQREALDKCEPIRFEAGLNVNRTKFTPEMVYVGNSLLLKYTRTFPGRYSVLKCDTAGSCQALANGNSSVFIGSTFTDAVFVQPGSLIQYNGETGAYQVTGADTSSCAEGKCRFNSVVHVSGNLRDLCTEEYTGDSDSSANYAAAEGSKRYSVAAVGGNRFFVSCKAKASFAYAEIYNLGSTSSRAVTQLDAGALPIETPFSLVSVVGVDNNLVITYTSNTGDYSVYQCLHQCNELWSSKIDKIGAICMSDVEEDCLADHRCGFCHSDQTCKEAVNGKACFGFCEEFESYGNVTREPASDVSYAREQFIDLDNEVVFNYAPNKGTYKMLEVVTSPTAQNGKCPVFSTRAVYEGKLPFKSHVASYFGNRTMFFVDTNTGSYYLWQCDELVLDRHMGMLAPCSVTGMGTWNASKGADEIFSMTNSTFIYRAKDAVLEVYEHQITDGSEDTFYKVPFNSTYAATIKLPKIPERGLLHLGNNYLLDHNKQTNEYKVYFYDKISYELFGPGAQGYFPMVSTETPSYIGDDRMMFMYEPTTKGYTALAFDTGYLGVPGNMPMHTIGAGHVGSSECEAVTDCATCAGMNACGWCGDTGTCGPGTAANNCLDFDHDPCMSYAGVPELCPAVTATTQNVSIVSSEVVFDHNAGMNEFVHMGHNVIQVGSQGAISMLEVNA